MSQLKKLFKDVRYFPNGIPSGNFPNVLFPNGKIPMSFLDAALDPLAFYSLSARPLLPILAATVGRLAILTGELGPSCILRRLRSPNLIFEIAHLGSPPCENTLSQTSTPISSALVNPSLYLKTLRMGSFSHLLYISRV